MNLDRYEYMMDETLLNFQFESLGPMGRVLKVIVFTPQNSDGVTYFNLAFGDLDKAQQKLDDLSVTNNNDREKVLATVAAVVLEFLNNFPDMMVYVEGSTPSRTRLYQIGIASQYEEYLPCCMFTDFSMVNRKNLGKVTITKPFWFRLNKLINLHQLRR